MSLMNFSLFFNKWMQLLFRVPISFQKQREPHNLALQAQLPRWLHY
jgi:hypothetical protein